MGSEKGVHPFFASPRQADISRLSGQRVRCDGGVGGLVRRIYEDVSFFLPLPNCIWSWGRRIRKNNLLIFFGKVKDLEKEIYI